MLMIDYARNVVGMPTRGLHMGKHVGWTTDKEKHDLMVSVGADCRIVDAESGRVIGYEVSFSPGAEVSQ